MVAFQGGQRLLGYESHPRRRPYHGGGHQHCRDDQCTKCFPLGAKYSPQVSEYLCFNIFFLTN